MYQSGLVSCTAGRSFFRFSSLLRLLTLDSLSLPHVPATSARSQTVRLACFSAGCDDRSPSTFGRVDVRIAPLPRSADAAERQRDHPAAADRAHATLADPFRNRLIFGWASSPLETSAGPQPIRINHILLDVHSLSFTWHNEHHAPPMFAFRSLAPIISQI